jgi:hypothetical protein
MLGKYLHLVNKFNWLPQYQFFSKYYRADAPLSLAMTTLAVYNRLPRGIDDHQKNPGSCRNIIPMENF